MDRACKPITYPVIIFVGLVAYYIKSGKLGCVALKVLQATVIIGDPMDTSIGAAVTIACNFGYEYPDKTTTKRIQLYQFGGMVAKANKLRAYASLTIFFKLIKCIYNNFIVILFITCQFLLLEMF